MQEDIQLGSWNNVKLTFAFKEGKGQFWVGRLVGGAILVRKRGREPSWVHPQRRNGFCPLGQLKRLPRDGPLEPSVIRRHPGGCSHKGHHAKGTQCSLLLGSANGRMSHKIVQMKHFMDSVCSLLLRSCKYVSVFLTCLSEYTKPQLCKHLNTPSILVPRESLEMNSLYIGLYQWDLISRTLWCLEFMLRWIQIT